MVLGPTSPPAVRRAGPEGEADLPALRCKALRAGSIESRYNRDEKSYSTQSTTSPISYLWGWVELSIARRNVVGRRKEESGMLEKGTYRFMCRGLKTVHGGAVEFTIQDLIPHQINERCNVFKNLALLRSAIGRME